MSGEAALHIGATTVGPGHPVYVVAEISANHNQIYEQAVKLIHAAKEAGADAVKLQTYTPDTLTIDCESELFRIQGTTWIVRKFQFLNPSILWFISCFEFIILYLGYIPHPVP